MTSTEKLISAVRKNGIEINGKVSTANDGVKYMYKRVELKYNKASNWLVTLFENSAKENGCKNSKSFNFENKFSFYYDRPKFNGQNNGKIWFTELIEF